MDENVKVVLSGLDELSPRDLYDMLKLRVDVFVVEQKCPYPELDGKDVDALHLRLLSGSDLVGSVRIRKPAKTDPAARIGRVVVAPEHRGKKLGDRLMVEAIAQCERLYAESPIKLSAQSQLLRFYESFGFVPVSEEYLEDGIPHVDMQRPAALTTE
ncbi:GNAT family N-acetyltransferase [Phyllobacterium chamaecytisi]|uniref:GNAT family N-acetyltransferase n=1 Tax=Phyllobacterium chamaecytisi TaxID=2876082 RepID=UPI001CCA2B8C|nr:GNAT family N-acetyltransferase [Phyllobacterium sp. KW56]MBZ9602476.1 GNAT family N-acetyltransferase [Phyllobacterium sp. KW56]